MKQRTIALACVFGVLAVALQIGLVLGLTHLLAQKEEPRPKAVAAAPAFGDPVRGPVFRGEVAPDVAARPVEPRIDWDFGPGGDDLAIVDWGMPGMPVGVAEKPVAAEEVRALKGPVVAGEHKISGPFTHKNLSVFFVHGAGPIKEQPIITLQEALERGVATVHEGGISITNTSDKLLFVQSGDIIKGGTQDRVLPNDTLIPAKTSRFPVAAFCVESGRSFPRAGELSTSFAMSCERVPTRELRLAAYRKNQGEIWSGVSRLQDQLGRVLGESVRAKLSATSLQLTLEHPVVASSVHGYVHELVRAPDGKDDIIGCVVAVEGKLISADVYASQALFQALYPKLLKAAAVEAVAAGKGSAASAPSADAVSTFLAVSEDSRALRHETGGRTHLIRHENSAAHLFDTCLRDESVVLHRSVLAK